MKNSVPVRHQGFSGRFTYNWKYRYFVNFNFGYTGSENFAVGNQFGFFPAFSMAWNIAEEPFIQNNFKWLNMFKVPLYLVCQNGVWSGPLLWFGKLLPVLLLCLHIV